MAVPTISEVHPKPELAKNMPYSPGIYVEGAAGFLFLSGATASPRYHHHPHIPEEHVLPDDIKEQTRRALANIKGVLDVKGMSWRHIVKVTKYLTDIREMDAMYEVLNETFGDLRPAGSLVAVSNLSSPGARVELDMIAVLPLAKE